MTFYDWMLQNHLYHKTRQGTLARDMWHDKIFPRNGDRETILAHLQTCDESPECLETFELCWRSYLHCLEKKALYAGKRESNGEGKPMSFYEWMMRKHLDHDTRQGKLAWEILNDETFPEDGDFVTVLSYLLDRGTPYGILKDYQLCWRGYMRYLKKETAGDGKRNCDLEGRTLNFYEWMMRTHLNRNTRQGDLADDLVDDEPFPKNGDRETILRYLEFRHACDECIETFKLCWKGYRRYLSAKEEADKAAGTGTDPEGLTPHKTL